MKFKSFLLLALFSLATAPMYVSKADERGEHERREGFVFVEDNGSVSNSILAFHREPDGALIPVGKFPTGGKGTGGGLGNQGALTVSRNGRWLVAVNAGSNEVSVFRIKPFALELTDKVSSGGRQPVSVTIKGGLVYVLNAGGNAGGADNIFGFRLTSRGTLLPLPDSERSLSAPSTGPAQIQFDRSGDFLVVTEKNTNFIDLFDLDEDEGPESHRFLASPGKTPFGFAIGRDNEIIVSEANGGVTNAGSLSAYRLRRNGALQTLSPRVADNQSAPCWVVITEEGRFAYTSNTAGGTISSYSIDPGTGEIALFETLSATIGAKSGPTDMALTFESRFLYVLDPGSGMISAFRVLPDGKLKALPSVSGIPASATGLVAD